MAGAGLCLILGGVGAIISYRIKGATEQTAMIGGTGVALALIVFLVHMLTDEEYRLEAVRNYMVDYLENIYQHRYEKTYKKEVLAEEARLEGTRIAESARTQENAGMTKNTRMPEEERMGENTRMPEEERMGENTRMQENTGIVKMYKIHPIHFEDDKKVKNITKNQKPGKTEKIEKTIESEETKAQDEANRNQRIREILEEFMA